MARIAIILMTAPRATYRLQLNRDFTFNDAARIAPYLAALGVSHCYASPYLKARAGSPHGYDIVDHNELNPEIGTRADYDAWLQILHEHKLGQIVDIVPNHMAVGSGDNHWWLDVLENGQASDYAQYFDIDWRPVKEELRGKVLCPLLGGHYGTVLREGAIRLHFDAGAGAFSVRYYEHLFPLDPKTYPVILDYALPSLRIELRKDDPCLLEFESLISAFTHLPMKRETETARREERNRDKELLKQRLAELQYRCPHVQRAIITAVAEFNGRPGDAASFDLLHGLLELQAYRLAFWQVAADEVNYRRFFDINSLAGIRTERPDVFEVTHRFILTLVSEGQIDGLRIDHPDGLFDPKEYYERLRYRLGDASERRNNGLYVVVEKILAPHEELRSDWPVQGTTGYDFAFRVNGLFVRRDHEKAMTRTYTRFIDQRLPFDDLLYQRKKLIMRLTLTSELAVLANRLDQISESDRDTRDFTLEELRAALVEIVACFPVYRTYVTTTQVTAEDRRYVDWAITEAKRRSITPDTSIFDFIRRLLLQDGLEQYAAPYRVAAVDFAMRFQQYTAPVMAKGLEDTTFYIYNRLVSLNDVGSDPRRFGISVTEFHEANEHNARHWPHTLLATSTHDTKRSEDVRARINVLSEMPEHWRARVAHWARWNRRHKREVDGAPAPSRNDEYLLYQTLIGAWPLPLYAGPHAIFVDRIEAYMLKAVREAKAHTSWMRPNPPYEEAVTAFVRALLADPKESRFLADFVPFQAEISRLGMLNSLSQTLLKLTAPGVPDLYQGTEIWDFSLVDPDNRRPVDYARRQTLLDDVRALANDRDQLATRVRNLLDTLPDGRAKLFLTWRTLALRAARPDTFATGHYTAVGALGARAAHVCAYLRGDHDDAILVVATRWFVDLTDDEHPWPLGARAWADTYLLLTADTRRFENVLTGETVETEPDDGGSRLPLHATLAHFPVALLIPRA